MKRKTKRDLNQFRFHDCRGQLSSSGNTDLDLNSSASEFKEAACFPVREEQEFMISGLRRDNKLDIVARGMERAGSLRERSC